MIDNQIGAILVTALNTAIAQAGYTYTPPGGSAVPYPVVAKQQPTQQGVPTSPVVFWEKLYDTAYGFAEISESYNASTQNYDETENQQMQTFFQVSAWAIQDPTNIALPTASDICKQMRMFLSSRANTRAWRSQYNVGILRVSEVCNPYIEDDRHRFEATPSFDIVLTHSQSISSSVGAIFAVPGNDFPV